MVRRKRDGGRPMSPFHLLKRRLRTISSCHLEKSQICERNIQVLPLSNSCVHHFKKLTMCCYISCCTSKCIGQSPETLLTSTNKLLNIVLIIDIYRTRLRSLSCHSLTDWLIHSVLFSTLDWCDPGVWGCQPKTYWSCYCSLNVGAEKRVGYSLVLIWRLKFGHKVNFLFRLWAQFLGFKGDFEAKVCFWCLVELMKFNLGWYFEAKFGQDFEFQV